MNFSDYNRLNILTLGGGLAFVQISYLLGGISFLDLLGVVFLFFAFLLYMCIQFSRFPQRTISYKVAFIILLSSLIAIFVFKMDHSVAAIDDGYHRAKIISYSLRNNFIQKLRFVYPDGVFDTRVFLIDFVESVWGLFWRYTKVDYSIILVQEAVLIVLWHQILYFLKFCGLRKFTSIFALAIIFNMQIYWSQIGSGYIDSICAVAASIVFFLSYRILENSKEESSFENVFGLVIVSSLCFLCKLSLAPIGFLGVVVVIFSFSYLKTKFEKRTVLIFITISMSYVLYHYSFVWIVKGNPLFPTFPSAINKVGAKGWYHYLFSHPVHEFLLKHNLNWRFLYVFTSWLFDYKYRGWITPDPWVGGNGILWTYVFVPVFIFNVFQPMFVFKKLKEFFIRRKNFVFVVVAFYWLSLDIGLNNRFMLGQNTFLMTISLQWAIKRINFQFLKTTVLQLWVALFVLGFAFGSYICTIQQFIPFQPNQRSVLSEQYETFPYYMK